MYGSPAPCLSSCTWCGFYPFHTRKSYRIIRKYGKAGSCLGNSHAFCVFCVHNESCTHIWWSAETIELEKVSLHFMWLYNVYSVFWISWLSERRRHWLSYCSADHVMNISLFCPSLCLVCFLLVAIIGFYTCCGLCVVRRSQLSHGVDNFL